MSKRRKGMSKGRSKKRKRRSKGRSKESKGRYNLVPNHSGTY